MTVRDKLGHRAAIVSIQVESCKIRTLISCSPDSTLVGYQQIKVTSKAERPLGTSSSKDRAVVVHSRAACQCARPVTGHQHREVP